MGPAKGGDVAIHDDDPFGGEGAAKEASSVAMHCSVCGTRGPFLVEPALPTRDNHRCSNCRSMQRQRDVAQIIVDEFGRGLVLDLRSLVVSGLLDGVDVYEVGIRGPIAARLNRLPRYVSSYFWDDVTPGDHRDGVQCQDLRCLTFGDGSFDLVVSLEVFEHVFEADKVVSEIARVLKPGGLHIFSVPVRYPFPAASEVRAEIVEGEIVHRMPERYHVAGDLSKSLVVTEWGSDIVELHERHGLRLSVVRRSAPSVEMLRNATMVARKLGSSGGGAGAR